MIEIYTDGSCRGNPGPGGWGAVVIEDGKVIEAASGTNPYTTNNSMEMVAILWAQANYGSSFINVPVVYSDSAYCVNSFTTWVQSWKRNGWKRAGNKPLENLTLIQAYDQLESQGFQIDLKKVPGHSGIQWNEVADQLATGKITPEEVKTKYGG